MTEPELLNQIIEKLSETIAYITMQPDVPKHIQRKGLVALTEANGMRKNYEENRLT